MKYLLDTHTLLWIVKDDPQLSNKARKCFLDEDNDIYVSIASLWEVAIKLSLNRLTIEQSLNDFYNEHVTGNDIRLLNINIDHLVKLESLEHYHRDPFDRLLACQCLVEKMPIISKDKIFAKYSVKRVW